MTAVYVSAKQGSEHWTLAVWDTDGELVLDAHCQSLASLLPEAARLPIAIVWIDGRRNFWSVRPS